MRKLAAPVLVLFLLVGCAGLTEPEQRINLVERLTLANNTIETTANAARTALTSGHISWMQACKVGVYSRLASAAIDQAWLSYVMGQPDGAVEQLQAAQDMLAGTAPAAAQAADADCQSQN